MDLEVQGYRLEHCFGPAGCSNRAVASDGLIEDLEALLQDKDLLAFLRAHTRGEVKLHQEFRITLADCPNACSRPQIVDIGIIGAKRPGLREVECSGCSECLQACREGAIELQSGGPQIDRDRCLLCGRCAAVCATGTLSEDRSGYRVLLGGKLGRHPRLGRELPGVCGREEVLAIAERCLDRFVSQSGPIKRFGELVDEDFLEEMSASVL
jgi:dissimilatory sulfite reductase (desulfoviridin) alpha/beta subunit